MDPRDSGRQAPTAQEGNLLPLEPNGLDGRVDTLLVGGRTTPMKIYTVNEQTIPKIAENKKHVLNHNHSWIPYFLTGQWVKHLSIHEKLPSGLDIRQGSFGIQIQIWVRSGCVFRLWGTRQNEPDRPLSWMQPTDDTSEQTTHLGTQHANANPGCWLGAGVSQG